MGLPSPNSYNALGYYDGSPGYGALVAPIAPGPKPETTAAPEQRPSWSPTYGEVSAAAELITELARAARELYADQIRYGDMGYGEIADTIAEVRLALATAIVDAVDILVDPTDDDDEDEEDDDEDDDVTVQHPYPCFTHLLEPFGPVVFRAR